MKLESQVVSLEISKRLKELGVKEESLFWWTHAPKDKQDGEWVHVLTYGRNNMREETISAFTVAELGGKLADPIEQGKDMNLPPELQCSIKDLWNPDYLAKLLIYLIENKLITV